MKRYSFRIREIREADNKIIKFKDDVDALISSEKFINEFRGYIEDIARTKRVNGRKFARSTEYAAIGILDINDLYQEAYLAFFEAYAKYKEDENKFENDGARVWSFLKKTTVLNFERQIRTVKDGIRVPERANFESNSINTNFLTKMFSQLEKVFFRNQEDVALTKWETDLVGAYLDVHFDEYLDLKKSGERNFKGIERILIKEFYGLDAPRKTSKELAQSLKISPSTVDVVRKRALDKLKSEESKEKIADFLHEYRIGTKADTEKYRK